LVDEFEAVNRRDSRRAARLRSEIARRHAFDAAIEAECEEGKRLQSPGRRLI
jgi:hypothetical protein